MSLKNGLRRMLGALLWCWFTIGPMALAAPAEISVTAQARYWVDAHGPASLQDLLALKPKALTAVDKLYAFELVKGALWLRYEIPVLDPQYEWYLLIDGPSYTNHASLFQQNSAGQWQMQQAGDHLPMSQWSHPDLQPSFRFNPQAGSVAWLRLQDTPTTLAPTLKLMQAHRLESRRNNALLCIGVYLGFGLLVIFLGWIHARLYGDRVFLAYMGYVACMLGFQTYYNGIGAFFITPEWPGWNDAAPVAFVCWLTAFAILFARAVGALDRHSPRLNRFMLGWALLGFCYPVIYQRFLSPLSFELFNLYALLSVLLSMSVFIWAWRKGETYAGWALLGFLPLYASYPFPALRAAGYLGDIWLTQHAMLIGSAIEIPLLLYVLHWRAKDFSENRVRMRAIESIDPLTGLTITPVLLLRLGDALKRTRRNKDHCGLVLVELANHAELVAQEGREVGDRALVVAAAQLSTLAREVDTVCRVEDQRFVVLLEGQYRPALLKLFAQHVVAKGLVHAPPLPPHVVLRYRIATIALPDFTLGQAPSEETDVKRLLSRLGRVLDKLDPKRAVIHLPLPSTTVSASRADPLSI